MPESHCYGWPQQRGLDRTTQFEAIREVLNAVAPRAEAADVSIVIEPLNIRVDHPRHFLTRSADAFELVESVDSPNAKVLFDIYHQQITDGDVTRRLTENIDYEGYVGCEFIPQGEPSAAIDDVVRLVNDIVEPASR